MSLPHEVELSNDTIDVHLAGPGYGEGVLIVIGEKIIIGMDCCKSLVQQQKKAEPSYLENRLRRMADDAHLYWLITHFHLDHFLSFNTVLDLYEDKLESVVVPPPYTEGDHYADMLYRETKEHTGKDMLGGVAVDQFKLVRNSLSRDSLKLKVTEGGAGSKYTWINTTLVLPGGKKVPLRVDYYGVSYKVLAELRGRALSKVVEREAENPDAGAEKANVRRRSTANEGSYIVHVRAGRFEGLFLGDSESHRTEEVLAARGPSDAEVIYLKVAHHGSTDGTTQQLLEKLCDTTAAHSERRALIAPFHGNDLPMPGVIQMLVDSKFEVKTSGAKFAETRVMENIIAECRHTVRAEVLSAIAPGADVITESTRL
jgi:hypothetical protein